VRDIEPGDIVKMRTDTGNIIALLLKKQKKDYYGIILVLDDEDKSVFGFCAGSLHSYPLPNMKLYL
jgi:hypothetical protein